MPRSTTSRSPARRVTTSGPPRLALGRARAGEPVAVETIARILPGIELPAITLALLAIAPERGRFLELVEQRRFPQTKDACELEAILVYAAWRAGVEVARVIPELRRLSARPMSVESYALLATVAASIDDANVAVATKPIAPFAKEYAKHVATDDKAMTASIDAVLASLPSEIETTRAAGFTVRAQKQAGRNDPCPCGSGLKYKKCCADKPQARDATPSPVPGLTWDEFLAGDRLTALHVDDLALRDLVRVSLDKLGDEPLFAAFRRFSTAREWTHAERVVAEAGRRGGPIGDDLRDELVVHLLECGQVARAREHVSHLPAELAKLFELELAIASGAEPSWSALVRAAREASTDQLAAIDLAYSLLRAEPALGILAARACIGALHVDDPDLLLELVEERARSTEPAADDPAWDVLEALTDEDQDQEARRRRATLRQSLAESSARVDELERTLAGLRAELASARTRPAAELMRGPASRDPLDDQGARARGPHPRRQRRAARAAQTTRSLERRRRRARGARAPRARRVTALETDDDVGDNLELGARERDDSPLRAPRHRRALRASRDRRLRDDAHDRHARRRRWLRVARRQAGQDMARPGAHGARRHPPPPDLPRRGAAT